MTQVPLLLNGRFLSRPMTGVDRSAMHLVSAMLRILEAGQCTPFTLDIAVPAKAPSDEVIRKLLGLPDNFAIHRLRGSGYFWEQVSLARIAPEKTLLSLCNTGPVARANQLVLIHDAQVYDAPESYSFPFRSAYRAILPLLARRVRHLSTVSNSSRERLQANGIRHPRAIEVVYNGMDHLEAVAPDESVLARNALNKGQYFLAFNSAASHKNVAALIRANAIRTRREMPLVLTGTGNAQALVDANRSNRPDVIFLGRVSDSELAALYANACAFGLPSYTEGFGLTAGEAMAAGCPVIASTGGALPEVYAGACVFVDPDDIGGWAKAFDRMAEDRTHRDFWAELGRRHAKKFKWAQSARILLRLLGIETHDPLPVAMPDPDFDALPHALTATSSP